MAALFDGFGMDPCIVQNYYCRATHSPRKHVKLLTDKRGVNGLFREAQVYAVVSGQQSKAVHTAALLAGHRDLLTLELPTVRYARQHGDTALVAVEYVYLTLLGQGFELSQNFALERVDIGIGFMRQTSSNALEAATVFFRKRIKVCVENSLPSFC